MTWLLHFTTLSSWQFPFPRAHIKENHLHTSASNSNICVCENMSAIKHFSFAYLHMRILEIALKFHWYMICTQEITSPFITPNLKYTWILKINEHTEQLRLKLTRNLFAQGQTYFTSKLRLDSLMRKYF